MSDSDADTDTNSDLDACEEAAQVAYDAMAEYCADLGDVCCFCQCFDETYQGNYDVDEFVDNELCSCVEPEPPGECTLDAETAAMDCLMDVETCEDNSTDAAALACDDSLL